MARKSIEVCLENCLFGEGVSGRCAAEATEEPTDSVAIDSAQASGATALNIVASPLFYANRHLIMQRAAAAHLPTIYEFPEMAEEGGFAAYGPRRGHFYGEIMPRQIVQLFRGIKVADIPVEQPTKFELVINLKTANAMGVTVPPALLVRADKVIE